MNLMHGLGCFVHGVLVFGHAVGAVYNAKRGNKYQAMLHFGVAGYDLWAVGQHMKGLHDGEKSSAVQPLP